MKVNPGPSQPSPFVGGLSIGIEACGQDGSLGVTRQMELPDPFWYSL